MKFHSTFLPKTSSSKWFAHQRKTKISLWCYLSLQKFVNVTFFTS